MKPEDYDDQDIRNALKDAFPSVGVELPRDLWPAMLRRLETPSVRVPWYDWALAACLVVGVLAFPKFVLLVVYHL